MREFTKAVCSLFLIIAVPFTVAVWYGHKGDADSWVSCLSTTLFTLLLLAFLFWLHYRPDLAHDFLRDTTGVYFNRGGFCFMIVSQVVDGICFFQAYYQNQHERPCVGRIALRPARGFFLTRANIATITFEIACDAAAFGVATLPVPLPPSVQGKTQKFEVGASVKYPQGRGKRLRFRDGLMIRSNTNFGNSFGTALTVVGALSGTIVLSRPATLAVTLPSGAAEMLPDGLTAENSTLWKLGDA